MHSFENFRTHTEQDLLDSLPRTITRSAPPAFLIHELHGGQRILGEQIAALTADQIHHVTAGRMFSEMIHGFRGEYDEDGEWYSKLVINLHVAVLVSLLGDQHVSEAGRYNAAYSRAYNQDLQFVQSVTDALMGGSLWEFGYIKTVENGSCSTYTHSLPWFDAQKHENIWKFLSGDRRLLGIAPFREDLRRLLNGNSPLPPVPPDYKALPLHSQHAQYTEMMSHLAAAYPPAEEVYGARVYGTEIFSKQLIALPEFQNFISKRNELNGLHGYYALAQAGALPGSVDLQFYFSTLHEAKTSSR